jgi:DNA-binding response OmpR family regulator
MVLDVVLPGLEGSRCAAVSAQPGAAPPVLMLTARDVTDRVPGLDAGADDYLTKPFTFAELSARLRALRRRGHRPVLVEVGDLRLDPARRRAWRWATELTLTAKEFNLLELFPQHPGEVLSRTPGSSNMDGTSLRRHVQHHRQACGLPSPQDRPALRLQRPRNRAGVDGGLSGAVGVRRRAQGGSRRRTGCGLARV